MFTWSARFGAVSKALIPAQRRARILEYLKIHKSVRNTDLGEMLDVGVSSCFVTEASFFQPMT
jgi:hypothetical protein